MAITLTGTIYDPYGNPVSDAGVRFKALRTGPQMLAGYVATARTDENGEYTIEVRDGRYAIETQQSKRVAWQTLVRNVPISAETTSTDINSLIVAYLGAGDATPEIVIEIESITAQATAAASSAQASAQAASDAVSVVTTDASSLPVQAQGGTSLREISSKLGETVSVKDFGAAGDGVSDDTPAFNAAFNSGAEQVDIPKGTYNVSPFQITTSSLKYVRQYGGAVITAVSTGNDQTLFEFPYTTFFTWYRPWIISAGGKDDGKNFSCIKFPQKAGSGGSTRLSIGGGNGRILDFSGDGVEFEQIVVAKVYDMDINCKKRNISIQPGGENSVPSTGVELSHLYLFGAESSIDSNGTVALRLDEIVIETSGTEASGAVNLVGGTTLIGNIYYEQCQKNYSFSEAKVVMTGEGFGQGFNNDSGVYPSTATFSGTAFEDRGVSALYHNGMRIREISPDPTANGNILNISGQLQFNGGSVFSGYEENDALVMTISDASSSGNSSPTQAVGTYTRVGRLVTLSIEAAGIDTSGMTQGAGLYLQGLPYPAINSGAGTPFFTAAPVTSNIAYNGDGVVASIRRNADYIEFLYSDPANASVVQRMNVSTLSSGSAEFKVTITYAAQV